MIMRIKRHPQTKSFPHFYSICFPTSICKNSLQSISYDWKLDELQGTNIQKLIKYYLFVIFSLLLLCLTSPSLFAQCHQQLRKTIDKLLYLLALQHLETGTGMK